MITADEIPEEASALTSGKPLAAPFRKAVATLLGLQARDMSGPYQQSAVQDLIRHLEGILRGMVCQTLAIWTEEAAKQNRISLMLCRHDKEKTCEVLGAVCEQIPDAVVQLPDWVRHELFGDTLPCESCHHAEQSAAKLPGTRLGKVERSILLRAAEAKVRHPFRGDWGSRDNSGGTPILPDQASASAKVAAFRARAKLFRLGLISGFYWSESTKREVIRQGPENYQQKFQQDGRIPTARRTPLGQAIVERYRTELANGKPIRWDERTQEALQQVRKSTAELVKLFARHLRHKNKQGIHGEDKAAQSLLNALKSHSSLSAEQVTGTTPEER